MKLDAIIDEVKETGSFSIYSWNPDYIKIKSFVKDDSQEIKEEK